MATGPRDRGAAAVTKPVQFRRQRPTSANRPTLAGSCPHTHRPAAGVVGTLRGPWVCGQHAKAGHWRHSGRPGTRPMSPSASLVTSRFGVEDALSPTLPRAGRGRCVGPRSGQPVHAHRDTSPCCTQARRLPPRRQTAHSRAGWFMHAAPAVGGGERRLCRYAAGAAVWLCRLRRP